MGITSSKQDINLAKKSYVYCYLNTAQTSQISSGDHVKWDTIGTQLGPDVTLDIASSYSSSVNTASIGRFTLKAGKSYKLLASMRVHASSTTSIAMEWYDATSSAIIGRSIGLGTVQEPYDYNSPSVITAVFTPSVDSFVELRFADNNVLDIVTGSHAIVEAIDSTISISPTYETAIGDWTSYNLIIGSTGTAPDEGGGTKYKRAMWRRVGDSMEILFEYRQSTGGSAGTGTYLWPIPPGYQIDTSKITTSSSTGLTHFGLCGHGWVNDNGGGMYPVGSVAYNTTNIKLISTDYSYSGYEIGSAFETFANTDYRVFFLAKVPIVGWNRDLVFADSRVEYVSNSSTNDGNDTSSFAIGIIGSVIPAVTNIYKKRVKFQTPIQQTDDIEIQADWDGQGIWNRWEDQSYDDAVGKYGPTWEYVAGSKNEIDVWMRGGQSARFINSTLTARTFTQENAAGSRWRVRKSANPLAVQTPEVGTTPGSSYARLDTQAGYGSSATNIIYFTNTNVVGSDLSIANDSINGARIIVNTTGGYFVEGANYYDTSPSNITSVISKNSSNLTTDPLGTVIDGTIIRYQVANSTYTFNGQPISKIVTLTSGDIIRYHGRGNYATDNAEAYFQVTRLW